MKQKRTCFNTVIACICATALSGCQEVKTVPVIPSVSQEGTIEPPQSITVTPLSTTVEREDILTDWKSQTYRTIDLEAGSLDISASGIYELTGVLEEGCITVNVDKNVDVGTVYLILNGAEIHSSTTAPIYIKEAENVVIYLEEGTINAVRQGSSVIADESGNPSSAIFSKADLVIAGDGTLSVTSDYNDGITSKDDLTILGGTITVKAVADGVTGKDALTVETATLTIEAGKDGMRATNSTDTSKGNIIIVDGTYSITAGNDAVQAEQVLQIEGGVLSLSSGGGYPGQSTKTASGGQGDRRLGQGRQMPPQEAAELPGEAVAPPQEAVSQEITEETVTESKKGLKAGSNLVVTGGDITVSSYEDAVHSNGNLTIGGGSWNIEAGDDAVHADGDVRIEAGDITIQNSNEGIEGSNITIASGTISLVSSDDGINVSSQTGTLTIDGGTITLQSGGDGLDSNGNIIQNGGTVMIHTDKIGAGDTPVDYDGTFTANGGTITDQNGAAIDYQNQNMGRGNMQKKGGNPGERNNENIQTS